jgi:hypothetical protein
MAFAHIPAITPAMTWIYAQQDQMWMRDLKFRLPEWRRHLCLLNPDEDQNRPPVGDCLIIWSEAAAAFSKELNTILAQATHPHTLYVLPIDATPLAPALRDAALLHCTHPADIAWQWRVAHGVPPENINRPNH